MYMRFVSALDLVSEFLVGLKWSRKDREKISTVQYLVDLPSDLLQSTATAWLHHSIWTETVRRCVIVAWKAS